MKSSFPFKGRKKRNIYLLLNFFIFIFYKLSGVSSLGFPRVYIYIFIHASTNRGIKSDLLHTLSSLTSLFFPCTFLSRKFSRVFENAASATSSDELASIPLRHRPGLSSAQNHPPKPQIPEVCPIQSPLLHCISFRKHSLPIFHYQIPGFSSYSF